MLIIEKDILILGQRITDGSDETTMTAETKCSHILLNNKRKFSQAYTKMKAAVIYLPME